MNKMLLLMIVLSWVGTIQAYSGGPPSSVCNSMTPGHGRSPQSNSGPYTLTLNPSKTTYAPNEEVTVTISGPTFKGFLIEARPSVDTFTTYGSFSTPANTRNPCSSRVSGENAALSHTTGFQSESLSTVWTAPNTAVGNVVFVYTVVEVKATYWVKKVSSQITIESSGTQAPTPTQGTIDRDPGCGTTKGCFPSASECTTNCDYLVTWNPSGSDDVEFTLKRKAPSNNFYIAVGLSSDRRMGDDSVTECVSNNGVVNVAVSFNRPGYSNERLDNPVFGVQLVSGDYADGILSCTIKRKKTAALAAAGTGRKKRAVADSSTFFDLNTSWYLLVAHGSTSGGSIAMHTVTPQISPQKIDFLSTAGLPEVTTPPPATGGTIDRDQGCGTTKGCFPSASECTTNCDYLVTWRPSGSDDVEFTLKRKAPSNNFYIAFGLSSDPKMGDDSVTECVSNDGVVDVAVSFNRPGYSNERLDNRVFGVQLVSGDYTDGILSCTIKRKKTAALAAAGTGRKKRAVADSSTFFDLNTSWYLLVAHGSASGGDISMHTVIPQISSQKIDFLSTAGLPEVTTPPPATGTIRKDKGCGETLGCYHDCKDDSCGFLFTWEDKGDQMDFTLSCVLSGNSFCAIGLSNDEKMGDDSVLECVSDGGNVKVRLSYNDGRSNSRLDDSMLGLTLSSSTQDGNGLRCVFSRMKTYALASASSQNRRKRAATSASTYFDMNNDYNLLYAYGKSVGGFIMKHDTTPVISSQKADFQSFQDLSATASSTNLIKLHAILMVIAWMSLATLGIMMPRFYKPVWGEGTDWCGNKRWFVLHRSLMVLTFLLTAVAFVIIFVHVKGYSEIFGTTFEKSHPIIGIIVTALTLTNPIMALFRPHPGTPKRPIFNVAHFCVGELAHILGVVNIFSGSMLSAINAPDYIRIILYVYVGWVFLVEVVCHLYDCSQKSKAQRGEAYEMKNPAEDAGQGEKVQQRFKVALLPFHAIVVIGTTIAVIVIIAVIKN